MTSASLRPAADRVEAELARAERRQARLEALLDIGMEMVRDLARRSAEGESPLDRIAARFVRVSRAVRMIVTIANWIDAQILALLRGETPGPLWVGRRSRAAAAEGPGLATGEDDRASEEPVEREALSEPQEGLCNASDRADRPEVNECFAFASWNDAINTICNALGISDRSRFLESDEEDDAPPHNAQSVRALADLTPVERAVPGPHSAVSPAPSPRMPVATSPRPTFARGDGRALE